MSQANQIDGAAESIIGNYHWVAKALNGTSLADQVSLEKASMLADLLATYIAFTHPDMPEPVCIRMGIELIAVSRMAIYTMEHWEERPKL